MYCSSEILKSCAIYLPLHCPRYVYAHHAPCKKITLVPCTAQSICDEHSCVKEWGYGGAHDFCSKPVSRRAKHLSSPWSPRKNRVCTRLRERVAKVEQIGRRGRYIGD